MLVVRWVCLLWYTHSIVTTICVNSLCVDRFWLGCQHGLTSHATNKRTILKFVVQEKQINPHRSVHHNWYTTTDTLWHSATCGWVLSTRLAFVLGDRHLKAKFVHEDDFPSFRTSCTYWREVAMRRRTPELRNCDRLWDVHTEKEKSSGLNVHQTFIRRDRDGFFFVELTLKHWIISSRYFEEPMDTLLTGGKDVLYLAHQIIECFAQPNGKHACSKPQSAILNDPPAGQLREGFVCWLKIVWKTGKQWKSWMANSRVDSSSVLWQVYWCSSVSVSFWQLCWNLHVGLWKFRCVFRKYYVCNFVSTEAASSSKSCCVVLCSVAIIVSRLIVICVQQLDWCCSVRRFNSGIGKTWKSRCDTVHVCLLLAWQFLAFCGRK